MNGQTGGRRGVRNALHHRFEGGQWPTPPVHADKTEEAVLDRIPLARAGRKMTDMDRQARLRGELLQLPFPQAHAPAVAAPAVVAKSRNPR